MSELEQEIEIEVPEVSKEELAKLSSTEKLAVKHGWNPNGKKSAEDYIEFALEKFPKRGEALTIQNKKLEAKDGELSEMRQMLNELASHIDKQKQHAYQQAVADVDKQRQQALAAGDIAKVEKLEAHKAALKPSPAVVEEFERNHRDWLNSPDYEHRQMKKWVLEEDRELAQYKLTPEQHIKQLETNLKKQFPSYFGEEEVQKHSAVDSDDGSHVSKSGKVKKTYSLSDLNPVQQSMAAYLKKTGVMKETDYIKQLIENGDLK